MRTAQFIAKKEPVPETIAEEQNRTGVFICDCGNKIASRLDCEGLLEQVNCLPDVVYACRDHYPCSQAGQEHICQEIAAQKLNRLVIAGCTPRLVEGLFQRTAQTGGIHPANLEIVDIREQCVFVHPNLDDPIERQAVTDKAATLIDMGVSRLAYSAQSLPHTNRVLKGALVLGSSLAGLTVALDLAADGILVTLAEPSDHLGSLPLAPDEGAGQILSQRLEAISANPLVFPLLSARIGEVRGGPGDYLVDISHDGQTTQVAVGAILIASEARPSKYSGQRWIDRARMKTQAEFEAELQTGQVFHNVVIFLQQAEYPSQLDCSMGIRQALHAKGNHPKAQITILYRDLLVGGPGSSDEERYKYALSQGITFFRYPKEYPPVIEEETVNLYNPLTEDWLKIPYERVVVNTPLELDEHTHQLSELLNIPQDTHGFLIEPRLRLRPGRFIDDGIFILGGAHQPVDLDETLFQAYLTSTRVRRFINQQTMVSLAHQAQVEPSLCTGCGECAAVCPTRAIHLEKRLVEKLPEVLSLSNVDPLRCTGCGSCAVACPVKAVSIPGWEDSVILAQISAALRPRPSLGKLSENRPQAALILALACEWSAYAAADIAGARGQSYPVSLRILRMNCSARFDPNHILWAFLNGAQGVFLGVCPPGECHYSRMYATAGNRFAQERVSDLQHQLADHGIDPRRIHLEFLSADDGAGFARAMRNFAAVCSNTPLNQSFQHRSVGV